MKAAEIQTCSEDCCNISLYSSTISSEVIQKLSPIQIARTALNMY